MEALHYMTWLLESAEFGDFCPRALLSVASLGCFLLFGKWKTKFGKGLKVFCRLQCCWKCLLLFFVVVFFAACFPRKCRFGRSLLFPPSFHPYCRQCLGFSAKSAKITSIELTRRISWITEGHYSNGRGVLWKQSQFLRWNPGRASQYC